LHVSTNLISPPDSRNFRSALLRWYRRHGRDLPWRRTRDPYAILISEFMLQQTQVATVLSYYNEWLRRWSDFSALARASESSVLRAWQGLGYYARARNLHATARIVVDRYGGRLPRTIARTRTLPGIGRYSAHALATFAFDESVPIVETNTARVLSRLFNFRTPIDCTAGREALWNYAQSLLPKRSARVYNSALLDLGALVCLPHQPKCAICPVKKFCRPNNPQTLPIKKIPRPAKELIEARAFTFRRNRILLEQSSGRWHGMWILPPARARSAITRPIHMSIFPFTNHRITLKVFAQPAPRTRARGQGRWFSIAQLASIPLPSPHRRAVEQLLAKRPQKLGSTLAEA
jgi:A/G-specific adenine glycosylase